MSLLLRRKMQWKQRGTLCPTSVAVRYNPRRALVGDTDNGKALKERIQELKQLLDAYRKGVIKEKK